MKQLKFYGKDDHPAQSLWFTSDDGGDYELWLAMKADGWGCWVYHHSINARLAGPCDYCVEDYNQWVEECR